MGAARRNLEDELRRTQQRALEGVSKAVHNWRVTRGGWWTINDFLNWVDNYYFRLPPRLAAELLVDLSQEEIEEELYRLGAAFLEDRRRRLGIDLMRQIERGYLLRAMDKEWVDYLTAMEDLRQGIGLQAYGQRDPLVEYRRASYNLFQRLLQRMREQALFYIFRASQAPVLQRSPLAGQQPTRPARSEKPKTSKKKRRKKRRRAQSAAAQSSDTAPSPKKKRRRRKR